MYTDYIARKIDWSAMTWDRWQSLILLILSIVEFTVGDAIGWLLAVAGFILLCGIIYLVYQVALWYRRRNGGTGRSEESTLSELFLVIRKLDERIILLEAELKKTREERNDAVRKAQQYSNLQREMQSPEAIPIPDIPPTIKVLLIVPKSNLPLADAETQDVQRSGLLVTPVLSPIGQVTFTREILASNHDGLWLAGHMDKDGNFMLDNNEIMSPSALTSMVRGRFQWVFLNTCQSIFAAQSLQNETEADIICTIIDVPDVDAYHTGALFANWLVRLGDTRAAYEQSKPGGNRVYVYLSSARPRIIAAKK